MIRAVLDTNTLASGAVAVSGPVAMLMDAWRSGEVSVVVSPHIVTELIRTLRKPYFLKRLTSDEREEFLNLLARRATTVAISTPIPSVVSSHADNLILATAQSADVAYLITGDAELQRLNRFQNIAILSPRQFLDLIEQSGGET